METALLLVDPDRSTLVSESTSAARVLLRLRDELAAIAHEHKGEVLSSIEDSYVFQFINVADGMRCGTHMQERMALAPKHTGVGAAKARMSLHAVAPEKGEITIPIRDLLRATAAIAANAKAGQLIVSQFVRDRIGRVANLKFKSAGQIEIGEPAYDLLTIDIYEAIAIKRVQLTQEEVARLFEQDPSSRSAGGFQAFLVMLQEKTNKQTRFIDLTISDLERIARYAFDYRQGGWQNKLKRIFGRVLGDDLGRKR
jgi:hypothetical protein